MKKIKIAIIGVLGYAGEELLKIIFRHPHVELVYLGDKLQKTKKLKEIFPYITGDKGEIECINVSIKENIASSSLKNADVVFLALPHGISMDMVSELMNAGRRVIDLSADYRIKNPKIYEKWYSYKHSHPELLKKAVYGLPEFYREQIKTATLIANPGCYPTSIILGCAPLFAKKITIEDLIVDSKSGISGGGRAFVKEYLSQGMDDTCPYQIGGIHRHIPEIEQELFSNSTQKSLKIVFTPNIVPQERGMISSIYIKSKQKMKLSQLIEFYANFYRTEPFVRVLKDKIPHTSNVINTNYCEIGMTVDMRTNTLIIFSAIDNLIKGASGQAVQNLNIMFNLDEKTALT
ncbi:MAG: N-acetyl-gamma-glutamyl-phosphate reductase [Elusimicrobiota bacterium]